jgi:transposase
VKARRRGIRAPGKYRRMRLFTLTLSNSRHAFRKVVWNSSSETWCKLHEEAFAYFGGSARTIRFDNLKEGLLKPDNRQREVDFELREVAPSLELGFFS